MTTLKRIVLLALSTVLPLFAFTPNPTLVAIADNTALDLGGYTCTGPVGESTSLCRRITDYSGMVYNPVNHTICLWGGGHATTFRDDIDIFSFETLTWDSAYVPTPCAQLITSNLNTSQASWISTGHPVSRHSYDLLAVDKAGEFLMMRAGGGRGSCYAGPDWLPSGKVAHYDFTSKQWTYGASMSSTWSNLASCELDPVSGLIVIVSEQSTTGIWTYDPVGKTAVRRLGYSGMTGYANNLVYFPPNDKFYLIDNGNAIFEVTLNRANWSASTITQMSGLTGSVPSLPETGFAYDPANGIIGGGVVSGVFHAFNPLTKTWTAKTIQKASSTDVGSLQFHAIDYDPVNNIYIMIANGHTWAYRYAKGNWTPGERPAMAVNVPVLTVTPNPFNTKITINYELQISNYELNGLHLAIYDINGKRVADFTDKIHNSSFAICNSFTWNASAHPAGVYIAQVTLDGKTWSKRLFLVK